MIYSLSRDVASIFQKVIMQKSTRKRCGHADSEIKHSDKKEKKDRYLRNVNFESRGPERGHIDVLFCPFSDQMRGRRFMFTDIVNIFS